MPARDFSRRFSLFFACMFLGGGVQLPFLPLWLAAQGLDAAHIGIVIAGQMAARAVGAPIGALVADRLGARRPVMIVAAFIGVAFNVLLCFAEGFSAILAVALLSAVFLAPVFPLGESAAVEGSVHHSVDYGRMRLWGSLSFVAGGLLGGASLQVIPVFWTVPIIAFGHAILALAIFALPPDEPHAPAEAGGATIPWTFLLSLPFVVFVAAASLGQSSHALLYGFGALNWDHAGYQKATIAAFWAVSIAAEVFLFAFSKRAAALFGGVGLVLLGASVGIVRWPLMGFDPPLGLIATGQAMHALTFAALHLGSMIYIQETVPKRLRNTAQGLYSAITGGVAMSLAIWASGPLFQRFGGEAYFAMAAMSAAATGFALLLWRISPRAPVARGA